MSESVINPPLINKQIDLRIFIYLFPLFFTFDLINTFALYTIVLFVIFFFEKLANGLSEITLYSFFPWISLLIYGVFQVSQSIDVSTAAYYFGITVFIPFLIFLIVTNINIDVKFLDTLIMILFISGIILTLYSLYISYQNGFDLRLRIPSIWIHYNLVAGYLMVLLFFAISFLVNEKFNSRSYFYLISLVLILLGLLMTQTRGIWLSTMVAIGFYIIKRPRLLVPVLLSVLVLMLIFYSVIVDRYLSVVNFGNDLSSIGRLQAWIASALLIQDNILWGYGFDAFRHIRDNVFTVYFVILPHSHNTYLTLWLELGLFGMLLYLSFFFRALYYSMKLKKRSDCKFLNKYLDGLQMSFVGFIVAFMFEPYFTILGAITYVLWFLIALSYYLYYNFDKISQFR